MAKLSQQQSAPGSALSKIAEHRGMLAAVVAGLVAIVVFVVVMAHGDNGDSATTPTGVSTDPAGSSTPSSSSTVAPSSPSPGLSDTSPSVPVPTGAVAADPKSSQSVVSLLDEVSNVLSAPTDKNGPDLSTLDSVAVDAALGEYEAQAQEYSEEGWRQVGTPTVVWVRRGADASTTRVRACIDSSGVSVVDAQGQPVAGTSAPSRSVNLFDLVSIDGVVKVASHSFPADADC